MRTRRWQGGPTRHEGAMRLSVSAGRRVRLGVGVAALVAAAVAANGLLVAAAPGGVMAAAPGAAPPYRVSAARHEVIGTVPTPSYDPRTPPPLTVWVSDTAGLGVVLSAPDGDTLYRYDGEGAGRVTCTGRCVAGWKPYLVAPGSALREPDGLAGSLATVLRPDGGLQVTYSGHPLYRYAADAGAQETAGDGLAGPHGRWHAVQATHT
jgi:predicted lipoprotein with Yx(FWY)xxD motif